MRRFSARIALPLFLACVLLTACAPKDKDLLIYFAKEWGKQHGLYDDKGELTGRAMARGAGQNLPNWLKPDVYGPDGEKDPAGNAAVDAGTVAKEIADNDKLIDDAHKELSKNPPDTKKAEDDFNKAVKARPGDWYYRNNRAFYYLDKGDANAAAKDLTAGFEACGDSQVCLAALYRNRLNFYASYQLAAFGPGDHRMLSNCGVHALGAESFDALAALTTGDEQAKNKKAAQDARDMGKNRGC